MKSGIYQIKNLITLKVYVGSAIDLTKRKAVHFYRLRNGNHHSIYLQSSFNKHGENNFEFQVLEYVKDLDNLIEREQFWFSWTNCCNRQNGYNLSPLAGSSLGVKHSEETKANWSKQRKGAKRSDETKSRIALARLGTKRSCETKLKQSLANSKRDKLKWPHDKGSKCKCSECATKRSKYMSNYFKLKSNKSKDNGN